MSSTITMDRDAFGEFLRCLKLLVECECTDCDIQGGLVRQKTNDKKCIIVMDMTSIFGDVDLSLSDIKQKVNGLKTFELDDTADTDSEEVTIEIGEKEYLFSDDLSKLTYRKPLRKMLDNQFIDDEEFSKVLMFEEDQNILSQNINSYMAKKRIKGVCEAFMTDMILCKLEGEEASFRIIADNNENRFAMPNLPLEKEISGQQFKIHVMPFTMDISSDIQMDIYHIKDDVLMTVFGQSMNNKIPITTYGMTRMIESK